MEDGLELISCLNLPGGWIMGVDYRTQSDVRLETYLNNQNVSHLFFFFVASNLLSFLSPLKWTRTLGKDRQPPLGLTANQPSFLMSSQVQLSCLRGIHKPHSNQTPHPAAGTETARPGFL